LLLDAIGAAGSSSCLSPADVERLLRLGLAETCRMRGKGEPDPDLTCATRLI